jgi:hypothetical protein
VDKIIIQFKGQLKEITIVLNKLIPIRYKV